MAKIKAGTKSALEDPRAVIFGNSVESVGKIKQVLEGAYSVPAVPVQADTLEELEIRATRILNKYHSIGLIVLSVYGLENPIKAIEIAKRHNLPIVVLVPFLKNGDSRPIDFSALGVTGFQWLHSGHLKNVAIIARRILKITTPINEDVLPKQTFGSSDIPRKPRRENEDFYLGDDNSNLDNEIDFRIIKKPAPSSAELIEKEAVPKQALERIEKSLRTKRHNGAPLPAVMPASASALTEPSLTPFQKSATITQSKEEIIMASSEIPDIADINTTLLDAIERLTTAASHHRAALGAIKEIAGDVHEATGTLLKDISRSMNAGHGKSAKKPAVARKLLAAEGRATKNHSKKEIYTVAGKPIKLAKESGWLLMKLLKKPGTVISRNDLLDGSSPKRLDQRIFTLRKKFQAIFGKDGPNAIVTHPGKGYSLNLRAIH